MEAYQQGSAHSARSSRHQSSRSCSDTAACQLRPRGPSSAAPHLKLRPPTWPPHPQLSLRPWLQLQAAAHRSAHCGLLRAPHRHHSLCGIRRALSSHLDTATRVHNARPRIQARRRTSPRLYMCHGPSTVQGRPHHSHRHRSRPRKSNQNHGTGHGQSNCWGKAAPSSEPLRTRAR